VSRLGHRIRFPPRNGHASPGSRPGGSDTKVEPAGRSANPVATGNEHAIRGHGGTTRQIHTRRNRNNSRKDDDSANRCGATNYRGSFGCSGSGSGCCPFGDCRSGGRRSGSFPSDIIARVDSASVDRAGGDVDSAAEAAGAEAHVAEAARGHGPPCGSPPQTWCPKKFSRRVSRFKGERPARRRRISV